MKSLQCSWIRGLFGDNFHDWKVIFNKKKFKEHLKIHGNVDMTKYSRNTFSLFIKKFLLVGLNNFPFLVPYLQQPSENFKKRD